MPKTAGNTVRPSQAEDDGLPINNLPGLYPTEDWVVHYWDVGPLGHLRCRQAVIQLPRGYASVCPRVSIGERGCVHSVRRWGVQCYTRVLQHIDFDPTTFLTHDQERYPRGDDEEIVSILIHATHFDLPAHFVLGSDEHPLLLFDPQGELKGSGTRWYTYLGALAHLVSLGKVCGHFAHLRAEDKPLYDQALGYLLQALREPAS